MAAAADEVDDEEETDEAEAEIDGDELSIATQARLLKDAKSRGAPKKQLSGKDVSATVWKAAVGGKQPGSSKDHEGLDSASTKSLAESDVAAALASRHCVWPLGS